MADVREVDESKPLIQADQPEEDDSPSEYSSSVIKADLPDDDDEPEGCGGPCDPKSRAHRFIFLVLICFLSFGSYFVYDNPAALQDQFKKDMKISTGQFMLMYSLYSWPNVILCFFGGYFMDKVLGLRWGAILFSGLVLLGQIIVSVGASAGVYPIILAGRFVFGLGGENLAVAQNTYAVSWFKGKELNMVFGLQLSFSRVGSTVNMIMMKPVYDAFGHGDGGHKALGSALWIGAMLCGLSLLCAFAAAYLDRRAERMSGKKGAEVGEEIQISDIKQFPLSFWLMCVICVAYYVAIFPFIGLALVYYQDKWQLAQGDAATLNSLVYIISAVASPVFGALVDYFGRNLLWVLGSVLLTWICHMTLAYTFLNPYIPVVFLGFAYSMLACALWPMVAFIIPEHQLGTAYGFMQSVQNLGLAVISMVSGIIVDNKGYLWLEVFFCAWLSFAMMTSVVLYLYDQGKCGGILNLSSVARSAMKEAEAVEEAEQKFRASQAPAAKIRPRTPFELRNRFMSRLGVKLPTHYEQHKSRFHGIGMLR